MKLGKAAETRKWEDAFERVTRQAEHRRAQSERMDAERRHLDWKRALVLRLLVRRFGDVPRDIVERIQGSDSDTLDRYAERLVVVKQVQDVLGED